MTFQPSSHVSISSTAGPLFKQSVTGEGETNRESQREWSEGQRLIDDLLQPELTTGCGLSFHSYFSGVEDVVPYHNDLGNVAGVMLTHSFPMQGVVRGSQSEKLT